MLGFARKSSNYNRYTDRSKPEKPRLIEAPQEQLKKFQKRIEELLKRTEMPDYLHSGIPGRSYLTCSAAHRESEGCTVTLDISGFYLAVSQDLIARLFIVTFKCARDVAELLAQLLCCDGHLATGSPASPLLSFLANREGFDQIALHASRRGGVFTLYIDDMAMTGKGIGTADIKWITQVLERAGFTINRPKTRLFLASAARLITGRVIFNGQSRAPNRQHQKMKAALDASKAFPKDAVLKASAIGRIRHVALLDDARRNDMRADAKRLVPPRR
ncbi:reverse transcriptase family protein [Rhodanobacter sp. L36]|uniref:reverse transcriptase family protein n=1 Tax=Rhodanobacter sp. L36 TaxID=1747221 RepID=UPI001C20209A|nr:reverse transcriptase family protein [Rhodanobacter sp. L36]